MLIGVNWFRVFRPDWATFGSSLRDRCADLRGVCRYLGGGPGIMLVLGDVGGLKRSGCCGHCFGMERWRIW